MAALFASGHAADLVLAAMAVEAVLLIVWRRLPVRTAIIPLLPGALLVLALRAALTDAGWPVVALLLALSWPVHLLDLRHRWGSVGSRSGGR